MDRDIRTVDDVLRLLDGLFAPGADRWTEGAAGWWDGFYADRDRPVPFFAAKPDENLASYLDRDLIAPGRALDLGCGPGRNALHLAASGFQVDAVDLSPIAIAWAEERARETGTGADTTEAGVRFHCGDAFALTTGAGAATDELCGPYDLVYDSGCFHHLPPHRRVSHLALLDRVLAPGGHFALTCFAAGRMGSELPDAAFYREAGLHGGLAYTPESLRLIFSGLEEIELRAMRPQPAESALFGEDFLWTALFRRPGEPSPIPVPRTEAPGPGCPEPGIAEDFRSG
ncbi:class I SAM-dependent methyltransferase [Streptomyces sp. CG1]|uniref:class I SAM-dependent methyltransferase n=1 Tax=Streptomyces sp. CG1 TaxID=1287523 RepID=UPI0034E2BDCF